MLDILRFLGATVSFENNTAIVEATTVSSTTPYDLVRKMRASICVLGPILARNLDVKISMPGGCVIGDRPIDIHLRGIQGLGAHVNTEGGDVHATAKELVGTEINMGGKFGSTVLGTGNVMMAATLAKGVTVIEQAACEPEVVDLANFLISMVHVSKEPGTRRIEIIGVKELHGAEHNVIPDRIEAGTFLVAAAATRSKLLLKGIEPRHQTSLFHALESCNVKLIVEGSDSHRLSHGELKSTEIITETFPGFATDMQAQMVAMLTMVSGISVVTEKIFPNRFMHVAELKRMGADIQMEGATAIIKGVKELQGAPIMASDLRASAALVIAGLMAKGTTEVNRVYHIDRGYEHIDQKLKAVRARITRAKGV